MESSQQRVTQRAPKSCLPCSRRKMRCSKAVPCSNCVRRNIPDQCTREQVILSKAIPQIPRPRIRRKASTTRNSAPSHDDGMIRAITDSQAHDLRPGEHHDNDQLLETAFVPSPAGSTVALEAANALESLAWGSHRHITRLCEAGNQNVEATLSEAQETFLITFHQHHVAWMHNVLHLPSFLQECLQVRQSGSLPNAAWLCCYYAVLSVSSLTTSWSFQITDNVYSLLFYI